jgi:hypothetical protein
LSAVSRAVFQSASVGLAVVVVEEEAVLVDAAVVVVESEEPVEEPAVVDVVELVDVVPSTRPATGAIRM